MADVIKLPKRCEKTALLNEEGLLTCACPGGIWERVPGYRLFENNVTRNATEHITSNFYGIDDHDPEIGNPKKFDYFTFNYKPFKLIIEDPDYYYIKVYINLDPNYKEPEFDKDQSITDYYNNIMNNNPEDGTKENPYTHLNFPFLKERPHNFRMKEKFGGVLLVVTGTMTLENMHKMVDDYYYYPDYNTSGITFPRIMPADVVGTSFCWFDLYDVHINIGKQIPEFTAEYVYGLKYAPQESGDIRTLSGSVWAHCRLRCELYITYIYNSSVITLNYYNNVSEKLYHIGCHYIETSTFTNMVFIGCGQVHLTSYASHHIYSSDSVIILETDTKSTLEFTGAKSTLDLTNCIFNYCGSTLNILVHTEAGLEIEFPSESAFLEQSYSPYPDGYQGPELPKKYNNYLFITGVLWNCAYELPPYVLIGQARNFQIANPEYTPYNDEPDTVLEVTGGSIYVINCEGITMTNDIEKVPSNDDIADVIDISYSNHLYAEGSTLTINRRLYATHVDNESPAHLAFEGYISYKDEKNNEHLKNFSWYVNSFIVRPIANQSINNTITINDNADFYAAANESCIITLSEMAYNEPSAYKEKRPWDDLSAINEEDFKLLNSDDNFDGIDDMIMENTINWNMTVSAGETTEKWGCPPYNYYVWDPNNVIKFTLTSSLDCKVYDLTGSIVDNLGTMKLTSFPCKRCIEYNEDYCPHM